MKRNLIGGMGRVLCATAVAMALGGAASAEESFDLDALIAAAKKEKPITVYDSTGKIVEMAKNFAAKYGLSAEGSKVKASAQLEMIIREARANNIQGDVSIVSDAPAAMAQLIPQGFAESWLPPDLAKSIPAEYQDPLTVVTSANVWSYNTALFDKCPVDNIWELTEPKWKGKVAMQDPLGKASYVDWFNQMAEHGDDKVAAAYKERYGKDLQTDEASATAAWVKALAANAPLLTDADAAAADAVGAPGQSQPFMGLISSAKFRDNADSGMKLGLCKDLKPWLGWLYPGVGLITKGTDSPNAARLFIHYVMTAEGIAPQAIDGKMSTNKDVSLPADEPSGIGAALDQLLPYQMATSLDDWDARETWQDFWRMNYQK
ncbi:ABC transporter substrate-binding protein [Rhizobium leguminosarum]|jgi:iron(III) transport system substrate-binding protein|uniref:ABC transporter substrate-binding protein n=1 Tax=Rhizobium leguminosarum TaxID=384 RepID=UPI000FEC79AC|nr:ABC transporter substrate-binding protein [Rhizobium leguminosarum]MBY2926783.1 ABC transporter substrate-binding protein [Rhizobium leguminosarum]MBY2937712.1 ABC transporter substrate-binding protein [Rhizobium leguminosarum]MBY2967833.1 ABC transporter substrate-binding protein [Rhizobium leguminosarum]MBY3034342.1 ABC transporter substrate-binding protein [Rhizobium leguminosarum]RWX26492.1 ABC transporter substrate-binding protein [Rhizobium leguminosarum]